MKTHHLTLTHASLAALFGLFIGCSKNEDTAGGSGGAPLPIKNAAEVEAFYKANPDFFVTATPEDIPANLTWENGLDQPELGSTKATKGGTLNLGIPDFPRTLRPLGPDANGIFRRYIVDYADMTYAVKHPNTDRYIPGLAREWAIDREDNTVFIRLDPEAKWSDGEPVTTEDVFFAFYFNRSPHNQAPWYQNFYSTKYSTITRYDDLTFSIKVADRRPDFDSYALELNPKPRHFYGEFDKDYVATYQWRPQPVTGPYVINPKDIKKGQSIAMRRNKDWWAKDRKFFKHRFNPDRISFKVIRDPNKSFEAFKRGDIDLARLNLAEYWYSKLPDDHELVASGLIHKTTFYNDVPQMGYRLWMNMSKPIFQNKDIRIGIQYATNLALVCEKVFKNDWVQEQTCSTGYSDLTNTTLRARPYSPEKAAEHFAAAGFTKRGPDGIFVNDKGERLSLNVSTGYKTLEDSLTILKQEAAKAGVEFDLEILDSTTGFKKAQEKKHDICVAGFRPSPTEIYPRYWDFFHSDNAFNPDGSAKAQTNNLSCYGNPDTDKLIDEYEKAVTHEDKKRLSHQLQEIVHEEAPFVNGIYPPTYREG
ncbi:MAG: extracellular solute-binding protein, partial [Verrucomicrobiota bacterium]